MSSYTGRFAPSPTGPLHLGSLVAALGSWARARQAGGRWLLRIEDIDPPRERPGATQAQLDLLRAAGLEPDAPPLFQSTRHDRYQAALDALLGVGLAFPCPCSRSDLEADGGLHRGPCRPGDPSRTPAIRFRVGAGEVDFHDAIFGDLAQDVAASVGDFVLRRADGLWAYQLAVVVDDAEQGITEVVRGADLLDSTPRQILLQRALGLPTPAYLHLPLVLDADGRKLSKSEGALAIDADHPAAALRLAMRHLGIRSDDLGPETAKGKLLQRTVQDFDPARLDGSALPPSLRHAGAAQSHKA
jgi:glutamyl-Q tRNA(Asp) synthetase